MTSKIAFAIGTWFGAGYFPKGPGTAGSVAAIVLAVLAHRVFAFAPVWCLLAAAMLFPLSVWAAGWVAASLGKEDPQIVVADEVVGQWVTLAGATVWNWKSVAGAFVLFRLFDIWKPAPVRQCERLPGGLGIVSDDVMAGVYGALVLFAAGWSNLY